MTLAVALARVGKLTDAAVAKLDKNRDGTITEAELAPLKKRLEKSSAKMEAEMMATPNPGPDSIRSARARVNDTARIDMAIAQAIANVEGSAATVQVKPLQAAVRKVHKDWAELLKPGAPSGGLDAALGAMIAAVYLPDDILAAVRAQ